MKLLFENWRKFLNEGAAYVTSEPHAYQILNLAPQIMVKQDDSAAARKAYLKLAQMYHPDKHPEEERRKWEPKFIAAKEAWDATKTPNSYRYARPDSPNPFPDELGGGEVPDPSSYSTSDTGRGRQASGMHAKHMFERKGARDVYESIKNIFLLMTRAIENKESINSDFSTWSKADIKITKRDWANLKDFFDWSKYQDIRSSIAGITRAAEKDFLIRIDTLKETGYNPKYEDDLQILNAFKEILGRLLAGEDKTVRPTEPRAEQPTSRPDVKPTRASREEPEDFEEIPDFLKDLFGPIKDS